MKVIVVGAGGHGQVVADILLKNATGTAESVAVGFVDDDGALRGQQILGLPVLGTIDDLRRIQHDGIVVAIGTNARRERLCMQLLGRGERLVSAVHPSAQIGTNVTIEAGAMICAGAIVNTGSRIRTAAIINTAATVDHHSEVGEYAHIAPGVHMGGQVRVGSRALVGIGAIVLPRIRVEDDAVVGAGAVVTADVSRGATVVGVPARVLVKV
jgi:sugar O-acyltransferase (sialic acid O-acetyltransferase NeuD family)